MTEPQPTGLWTPGSTRVWALGDPDDPDLRFNGTDAYGVTWVVEEPAGWSGSAQVDMPLEQKAGDGAWPGAGRRQARVLEFRGAARACSPALLEHAEQRLMDAVDHLTDSSFVSVTEDPPKQQAVRQASRVFWDAYRGQPRARTFSFNLVAGDPLKYAAGAAGLKSARIALLDTALLPGLEFPAEAPYDFGGGNVAGQGQKTIAYEGRAAVGPLVLLFGPCPPAALTNLSAPPTWQTFRTSRALQAGQVAEIDMAARTVRINGRSDYSLKAPGSRFWQLYRGLNDIRFTAESYDAAAEALIQYRPAWK